MKLEDAVGQKLLVAFEGREPPSDLLLMMQRRQIGGVTLFRSLNVDGPAQVRALTASLQHAAAAGSASHSGQPPLLICADQEGGTLLALSGTTPFPGNMALGATRSPELARRVGRAIGRELAAMGVNVNYAPVCDVNVNPRNPVIGPRSFGEDPVEVGQLAGAMVEGLQEAGVAATAKHFPGHGDTSDDSHHRMPVLPFDEERLGRVELPPFAASVQAGVKLVMTAHIAVPALTDGMEIPATLSGPVLQKLLRSQLGFDGVIVSDAMDMAPIGRGPGLIVDAIAASLSGVDLLLLTDSGDPFEQVHAGLLQAARRGLLPRDDLMASARRVLDLKAWSTQQEQPGLEVVSCREHLELAYEVAACSATLVRDEAGLLPLRIRSGERIATVVPRPEDLTPADTSSYETPRLGEFLHRYYTEVDEVEVPLDPSPGEVAALRERLAGYTLVVVCTINAYDHPGQAALVNALMEVGVRVVAVALRMPYDLAAYPSVGTFVCTYSLHPPAMQALADALWGRIPFQGRLPVTIPSG